MTFPVTSDVQGMPTAAEIFGSSAPPDLGAAATPLRHRLLDDVQVLELPDPEWLIEGILPRRGRSVLYGPPGSYKTTLVASLLVAVATGKDWHGHAVKHRGACVYVGAEDPSGFKLRLAAAKRAERLSLTAPIGVYTYPDAIDLREPTSIEAFIAFLTDQGGAFEQLVIDTYSASTPGASENSSEDTTAAMTAAHRLSTALRAGVLLVHHTNASGSRERGHSAMRGSADAMLSITPVDAEDAIELECSKQRNGPPFGKFTLRPTPVPGGGLVLRLAKDVFAGTDLTSTQTKVLAVLRDTFSADGATKGEWQRACHDVAERSFHRAAKVLVERKHVIAAGSHFRIGTGGAR